MSSVPPRDTRSWTTDPQWTWLWERYPSYLVAQKGEDDTRQVFFNSVYHDWFVEWPEILALFGHSDRTALSEEQLSVLAKAASKRRKQIRTWFKNRKRVRGSTKGLGALLKAAGVTKKTGRLPQATELYSSQNYDASIKPVVTERLRDLEEEKGKKLTKKEILKTVKDGVKEAYDAAPAEVRAAIATQLVALKERAEAERQSQALALTKPRTAHDYQVAIDTAPRVIEQVFNPLAAWMGWTISVIGAGPVPAEGGSISSMAAHFGTNTQGHNFAQATPDYHEQYVVPMGRFAKGVFPRDVRERRRLDREPTPVPEEETLSTTPIDREPTPVPEEETLSTTPIAGPHRVPPIPSVPGPAPLVQSIAIPPPSIDHDPLMMDLNTIDYNQLSTDVAFISSMHAAFEAAGPISPDQIGHINTSLFDPGLPTVYTAQAASLDTPALSGVASSGPIAAPPAASPPAPVACPPTVSASAAPAPAESSPSQATSKQRKKPKPRPVRNTTSSKAQAAANVTATPTAPVEEPAQPVPEGATLTRSGRASKGARPADADWADNGKTQNKNKRGPDKENVDVAPSKKKAKKA